MARQPFYGRGPGPQIARMDMNAATAPGRAYGQMFANLGKIAGDSIEKYAEGKKKKEEQDELIKGTKAFIMGNPELGRMLNIQATDDISYEDAVNQAVPSLIKNPKGLETIKGLTAMAAQEQLKQVQLEKFNRESEQRKADTLFSEYEMGTKTGGVPALGTITNPAEYARVAQQISNIENNPFLTNILAEGLSPRVTQAQTLGTARKKLRTEKKEKRFGNESSLRKEFSGLQELKDFKKVRTAYDKVIQGGTNPSPAGDISMIFNYMKILDPGSTVREGEFATAQNATNLPQQIVNKYNQVKKGERLGESQRDDFMNQARLATLAQFKPVNEQMDRFTEMASTENLRVNQVLPQKFINLREELAREIKTVPDDNSIDNTSKRALQSTPSATPFAPGQPSQATQSTRNMILQKAQNGEPLTPKEQRIVDLLQKKQAQGINP